MTDEDRKQRRRESRRKWRESNRESIREKAAVFRENNRDAINAYARMNHHKYIDQQRVYRKTYSQEHFDKLSRQAKVRRSKKISHCVYCIEVEGKMYIGSTIEIGERIALHKRDLIKRPKQKVYAIIQEAGGWDAVKVHILMKDIPFEGLRIRLEQHFIDLVPEELRLNTIAAKA